MHACVWLFIVVVLRLLVMVIVDTDGGDHVVAGVVLRCIAFVVVVSLLFARAVYL